MKRITFRSTDSSVSLSVGADGKRQHRITGGWRARCSVRWRPARSRARHRVAHVVHGLRQLGIELEFDEGGARLPVGYGAKLMFCDADDVGDRVFDLAGDLGLHLPEGGTPAVAHRHDHTRKGDIGLVLHLATASRLVRDQASPP
jgi:hypothetical protein